MLGSKRILLFKEMLLHIGYGDSAIADCMKEGFDLIGPIPPSGVFQTKATFASLHKDHVRAPAAQTRTGIIHSARRELHDTVIGKVFSATMAEVERGWLVGPMSVDDLPDDCSVTRRFGVHQGTHVVDGVQVPKVRPIDGYTESLINLTNSSSESIEVRGIDAVVSGVALRIRVAKERGVCENLNIRTLDLRKAYKHLPPSDKALRDAYIVVVDPGDRQPRIFQSLVLPFGARAAVMGFCRTSRAIWQLGVSLLYLHWSVYFDDFILIDDVSENAHLNLVVTAFFSLLGWEIADDKGSASRPPYDGGARTIQEVRFARALLGHSSACVVTLFICLQTRVTNLEGWPVLVVYC